MNDFELITQPINFDAAAIYRRKTAIEILSIINSQMTFSSPNDSVKAYVAVETDLENYLYDDAEDRESFMAKVETDPLPVEDPAELAATLIWNSRRVAKMYIVENEATRVANTVGKLHNIRHGAGEGSDPHLFYHLNSI